MKDRIRFALKAYRLSKGWTMLEMAQILETNQTNLSRIETGVLELREDRLHYYLQKLGISLEELLSHEPDLEGKLLAEARLQPAKVVQQREAQIQLIHQHVEAFSAILFREFLHEEVLAGCTSSERQSRALEKLWQIPGIDHLLNGMCTSADFSLLKLYQLFKQQQNNKQLNELLSENA